MCTCFAASRLDFTLIHEFRDIPTSLKHRKAPTTQMQHHDQRNRKQSPRPTATNCGESSFTNSPALNLSSLARCFLGASASGASKSAALASSWRATLRLRISSC